MGKYSFEQAVSRLNEKGVGFNEVMPLERVLEADQAHQPGKLRNVEFRGLEFEVPEFPGQAGVEPDLPPPELGEHTVDILLELGYRQDECDALLANGAVKVAGDDEFTWAKVRK